MMTALSAKAQAFSVDQLLLKKEKQKLEAESEESLRNKNEETCASMGDEPACQHKNYVEVLDGNGHVVKIELCQAELWHAFHRLGTEMIITKTGRRMFPAVRIRISGLNKSTKYKVKMDFLPVDKNKYRYVYHSSRWMMSGVGESMKPDQIYDHPESPMLGEYMTSQVISFEKIKLTNHEKPSAGQISLLSMQKFQPRITIEEKLSSTKDHTMTATFPQTSFIAVTAYQNQEITRLKIARNPFAKGFREAGKCRSSLEAMMESFGVVIDQSQTSPPGKRRYEDIQQLETTNPKQPKQSLWSPTMITEQGFPSPMLMYPSFLYHQTSQSHMNSFQNNTRDISKQGSDFTKQKCPDVKSYSSSHDHKMSSSPSTPLPLCFQFGSIHPAFPFPSSSPQSPIIDPHILATYYKGLVQNPSYPNVLLVPSSRLPVTFDSLADTETSSSRTISSSVDNSFAFTSKLSST
ncbi:T-box transcription factor tbx18 [Mactra antiquata]